MKLRSLNYYHNETEHQKANSIIVNTMNLSNQVTTALAYPFPNLTKITGKPTAATLKNFTKQVFTNARAIHCHQHGGHYGHLGLIMPDTPYQALTHVNNAWADTAIPTLPTFAATDDAVNIANRMKTYRQSLARATTQNQVESDLKAQMLVAVALEYLNALEDETLGFANVTAREIYAHLMNNYGVVKAKDIEANRTRLSEPWTPDHTIESLWKRIMLQPIRMPRSNIVPAIWFSIFRLMLRL